MDGMETEIAGPSSVVAGGSNLEGGQTEEAASICEYLKIH